ncbi:YcxB family protein [Massilia norwichensis]|uniref:YcxB family protein n=1 Tax=Massilia norwichensis TaxID=1442366 RepID=A0ABT2A422_9BURK|nr:YcxB family protein [Massilia norwichensis]MCS0588937.1 YcxB family protein [Massilia norwichensis]
MQIVQQKQRPFAGTELTIENPPSGEVAPPPDAPPIRFSVSYTLAEYMSILRAHLGFILRHTPKGKRLRQTWLPLEIGVFAALTAWMLDPGWASGAFAAVSALAFLSLPFTLDVWVALIAPPVFFLKKRRMPVCEFRIDGQGIARTSRLGIFEKSWDEVKMVRRYERGYLLMFAKGGIPIPFRCLDQCQREQLRGYTAGRVQAAAV